MFSWFRKKKEVFLSPEVNGVVTENGTPIANLEIIRSLIYIDEKVRRDIATTDEDGRFHFPKKTILSSIPNKLIVENRVSQEIFIESESTLIPLWVANQSSIIEIPEYSQKLAFLECELTNKRVTFEFKKNNNEHLNYVASSICRWKTDYMPFWLYDGDREYKINNGDFNNLTERNIKED
ncbi:carboxypeptidase-like regulatory domain-containing protein [Pseudoalteromonas aliena]|uniref:DUF6795 domain-containing protein n=1 Tax=Pseudoalteromonas aliena SW19 TaxID=1314866 RepID=A0ABR9E011_9GAMM|nr:carboxypeptidase-like regulatory domain-containing protein [Pseudoalteromonas aliena]MBE0359723.1 hypothetical protein [Pseudoalteromonas aliena SW19]